MTSGKTFEFPVSVRWEGARLTSAEAPGKPGLTVATPPEFPGGTAGVWSPEELLVASAAACYVVTLAAVAEHRRVPLRTVSVAGLGRVGRRDDGSFGFTEVELDARVETESGWEAEAAAVAEAAERRCLVAASLDLPVTVRADVRVAPSVAA